MRTGRGSWPDWRSAKNARTFCGGLRDSDRDSGARTFRCGSRADLPLLWRRSKTLEGGEGPQQRAKQRSTNWESINQMGKVSGESYAQNFKRSVHTLFG